MRLIYLTILLLLTATPTLANKLNVQYVGHEQSGDGYITLEINVSWENSWRDPVNWDAAWIFIKYREPVSDGAFKHLYLTPDGHWAPSQAQAEIIPGRVDEHSPWDAETNPVTGVFIQRRPDFVGGGHVNFQGVKLRADISQLDFANMDTYDIRVFGIEMVYVPEGSFYLGSGGSESGRFKDGSSNDPFQVSSEAAINIANELGSLWGSSTSGDNTIGSTGALPAAFPKGYNGFYVMKYQVSQEQYAAFLNSLAGDQAGFLQPGNFGDFRQGVTLLAGNYVTATPFVAQNYLTWQKGAAYLDWAGLRPMSELEYEKTARGSIIPFDNEFAWGNTTIFGSGYIQNPGEPNENGSHGINEGGGDVIISDGFVIHTFKTVGEFEFLPPPGVSEVEVLVVAGGGAGGFGSTNYGSGGGGAGGLIYEESYSVSPSPHTVIVGDGSISQTQAGGNSQFGSLIAIGGGSGSDGPNGMSGGSGGGVRWSSSVNDVNPGSGVPGQGHDGGYSTTRYCGGGGGGAGEPGSTASSNNQPGGDGLFFSQFEDIAGDPPGWFAGGGGAGGDPNRPEWIDAPGGLGGGGIGRQDAVPNTGGGGGGRGYSHTVAARGGSGIVIVRYPIPPTVSTNAAYGNHPYIQGPLRVGSFADSSTNRIEAGATYWGMMEMSGNLWERVVSVGNTQGRAFTGLHGNGELAPMYGFATTENWPGWDSNSGYVDGMSGTAGFRGGSWFTSEDRLRTSDRYWAAKTEFPAPMDDAKDFGIRGVRTAPQD